MLPARLGYPTAALRGTSRYGLRTFRSVDLDPSDYTEEDPIFLETSTSPAFCPTRGVAIDNQDALWCIR
jgi:hypothetical protein